ncbi:hypothetical protein COV82_05640 [Candidatus Peregrinibacteria bacterium CG11_big_fil_rev_8_21_14_0_20_46_8]|nr:MAG: hypothetical protein COV82_05640 [Candidatus Peregrinibacteria bacterium CG11_big_fil_rev_8_21_14_0_20_46_8]
MDDFTQFLTDPLNAQLVALLEGAPLAQEERESWLEMLPMLNDSEKKRLITNLQEEIIDFEAQEEAALSKLLAAHEA